MRSRIEPMKKIARSLFGLVIQALHNAAGK